MGSHSVHRQLALTPRTDGAYDARLELKCGCELSLVIAQERIVELTDGQRRVVGKYSCPKGHAVTR